MKTKNTFNIILVVSILFCNPLFSQQQVIESSPEVSVNKFMILLFAAGILLGYYKLVHSNKVLKAQ